MIVSFKAKQNNKQTSPFTTSDYPNIRCGTDDFFFNCPRDWWMIRKKPILNSGSVQLLRFWSPFTVFFQSSSEKRSCSLNNTRLIYVRVGLSSSLTCSLLLISDARVLEIAFCTGFSVSLLLGHLPWFPSPCDRLVFNTALLVESKLSAHANNSSSRPRVSRNEHLECHPDSCSASLFYASFSLSALSFQDGFFHQAEITALGSSHASQLTPLLFSVSVWKLQGYADWVGWGWGAHPWANETLPRRWSTIIGSSPAIGGGVAVLRKKEDVGSAEERMSRRQNSYSLVTW